MFSQFDSFQDRLRISPGHEGFVTFGEYSGSQYPMHRHEELEFNLVARGTGRYILGDRRYDLGPGALVWLFPEQDHILLERSPDYAHWILVFRPGLLARVAGEAYGPLRAANPPGYFCRRLRADDYARLDGLLTLVRETPREDADRLNAGLLFALLVAWNAYGVAETLTEPDRSLHPAVDRAVRFLRRHSADDHSVAEIADACGVSGAHLARLFHRQTGLTLTTFRNRERVKRFLESYRRDESTLLSAALGVGFGSYAQFHRAFREVMGCGPAEYGRRLATGRELRSV